MAGDFNKPATGDTYAAFTSSVRDLAADIAKGLDPAVVSTVNIPTNTVRWTSASNMWQKWNGSAWVDLSSSYAINISGNAATATSATNASNVPWSGVSSKPTTIGGFGITDLVASILASFRKDNWSTNGIVAAVSGLLAWKNYGNNHVIFDASAGTAPDGSAVSGTTPTNVWVASYPTLMGWNGVSTHGVRVDSARWADGATNANTAAACTGNSATATTAGSCTGNSATATTAGSCTGNSATATTAGSCTGNSATATTANAIANGAVSTAAKIGDGIISSAKLDYMAMRQLARAWVNFDGTLTGTITPRANFNISSVTKNTTGDYTLNFGTALADGNYSVGGMSIFDRVVGQYSVATNTTTSCRIINRNGGGTSYDSVIISAQIFGT